MENKDTNNQPKRKIDKDKYKQVLIKIESHALLLPMRKKFRLSNLDIIHNALVYVNKMGFDPKDLEQGTTPANEIKKLRTTVVSFMRNQEKEILYPMVNKLDGAVSILVEYLREVNPSLIKKENDSKVSNIVTPQDSEQVQSGSKFKLPSSIKVNDEIKNIPLTVKETTFEIDLLNKENFNLQVLIEKKDKEIKRLIELLNSISNKITPKSFGSGYSIEITKEEIDELKSM